MLVSILFMYRPDGVTIMPSLIYWNLASRMPKQEMMEMFCILSVSVMPHFNSETKVMTDRWEK